MEYYSSFDLPTKVTFVEVVVFYILLCLYILVVVSCVRMYVRTHYRTCIGAHPVDNLRTFC